MLNSESLVVYFKKSTLTQLKLDNNTSGVTTQNFNWITDFLSICAKFPSVTIFLPILL